MLAIEMRPVQGCCGILPQPIIQTCLDRSRGSSTIGRFRFVEPVLSSDLQPPERIARVVAAHKELTRLFERLEVKRAEIERWDNASQDEFSRAFGSTDKKARQAVLAPIDRQRRETNRALSGNAVKDFLTQDNAALAGWATETAI